MSKDFCFFHPRDPKLGPVRSTLNPRAIRTIIEAIQTAWTQIETFNYWKSPAFAPGHYSDEDQLSTKLLEILNDQLMNNSSGFCKEYFQTVVRDGKQSTATTKSIDQMPDLTFRTMHGVRGEDLDEAALFVEAKVIDQTSGCRQYVVEGLYRFVSGKYAPRMSFGMMLGYAAADYADATTHLPIYYGLATSAEALRCKSDVVLSDIHQDCAVSHHDRELPSAPDFRALHLWLVRPANSSAPVSAV